MACLKSNFILFFLSREGFNLRKSVGVCSVAQFYISGH